MSHLGGTGLRFLESFVGNEQMLLRGNHGREAVVLLLKRRDERPRLCGTIRLERCCVVVDDLLPISVKLIQEVLEARGGLEQLADRALLERCLEGQLGRLLRSLCVLLRQCFETVETANPGRKM